MANTRPVPPAHVTFERGDDGTIHPDSAQLHRTKVEALEHAVREGGEYAPWTPGQTLSDAIADFRSGRQASTPTPRKARAARADTVDEAGVTSEVAPK